MDLRSTRVTIYNELTYRIIYWVIVRAGHVRSGSLEDPSTSLTQLSVSKVNHRKI